MTVIYLVNFALAGPIETHQPVFCSDQEVDTPKCGTKNLRVESLLVFPDFRCIGSHVMRRRRHIDARALRFATRVAESRDDTYNVDKIVT